MSRKHRAILFPISLAVTLGLFALLSPLVSADVADNRLVAIVEAAMSDWSESVYSGSFHLRQSIEWTGNPVGLQGPSIRKTIAYCVFDRANNRFRFERTLENESLAFIDSPNGSVAYSRQSNVVAKYAAGRAPVDDVLLQALDIRLIGFANRTELRNRNDLQPRLLMLLSSENLIEVTQTGQGDVQATWQYGHANQVRRTISFSGSQNYRPTMMKESYHPAGRSARAMTTCDVKWTDVGGSLVPLECTLEQDDSRLVLQFEWVSVNTPLDDKEFTVDGLDLPDGTLIANYTLGESKSFVEGRIGDSEESTPAVPTTWSWRRRVLLVNLVALPLMLIAYLVVRRWKAIA